MKKSKSTESQINKDIKEQKKKKKSKSTESQVPRDIKELNKEEKI